MTKPDIHAIEGLFCLKPKQGFGSQQRALSLVWTPVVLSLTQPQLHLTLKPLLQTLLQVFGHCTNTSIMTSLQSQACIQIKKDRSHTRPSKNRSNIGFQKEIIDRPKDSHCKTPGISLSLCNVCVLRLSVDEQIAPSAKLDFPVKKLKKNPISFLFSF